MKQEEVNLEVNVADDQLKELSSLAADLLKNDKAIEDLESALATLKQQQRQISEVDIPNKMKEMGMLEFVTTEGVKLKVKSFYTGYIPTLKASMKKPELADRRQRCLDYLSNNGHESLIKNELSIIFSKGQDNEAKDLKADLENKGHPVTLEPSVNAASLKAHINVLKKDNKEFDDELFNVFLKTETKIERKET